MIAPADDAGSGDACLHVLFDRQAAQTPDRVAVTFGDRHLTYAELARHADVLADRLRRNGAGRGTLVALYLDRSSDLLVAILAVLKTGAAYLPLDVDAPPDRVAFTLTDASAHVVVTHGHLRAGLAGVEAHVLAIDADDELSAPAAESFTTPASGRDLAYVIYTSGSTGTPKGVQIEHRSVVSLFRAADALFDFGPDDVWTLFHSTAFDFSVWEMWGAWLHGGRVVVVPLVVARSPEQFRQLLVTERVTVLSQTPSAFVPLMHADRAGARPLLALRYIVFGGEALDPRALAPWFERHGDETPRVINMYGITETTVHVTYRALSAADAHNGVGSVIGTALPGVDLLLLDGDRQAVPAGAIGEMYVGGWGLARGYLNRPALTAERFIPNLVSSDPSSRLYASGDLARQLPSGELEYVGRADQQVKIRGFRIELGEIESVLGRHPGVSQCAVATMEDGGRGKSLVAYWVPRSGTSTRTAELYTHLTAALPAYMVPSAFVEMPSLPLTSNGKLDRRALPAPKRTRFAVATPYAPPRDELERALCDLWTDVLGVDRVGIDDDFFELGGDSLLAVQLGVRTEMQLGASLPVSTVFERPTVARLARAVADARDGAPVPAAVRPVTAAEHSSGVPMSHAQSGLWLVQELSGNLDPFVLADAWRVGGSLDTSALQQALDALVSRHAPLRTRLTVRLRKPVQIVDPPRAVTLASDDIRHLPAATREEEANRLAAEEAARPFNLNDDLLIRARLVILDDCDHMLLLTVHHVASDAWSQQILRRELGALYEGFRRRHPASLPPLATEYPEHSVRQRAELTSEREGVLRRFWTARLADLPTLHLPTDFPRPRENTYLGAERAIDVPSEIVDGLRALAGANRATLQMVLMAACQVLLGRCSGQTDFGIATAAAGRDHLDLEPLIGLFVNTLIVRADLSGAPSFLDVLGRVRAASLEAYDHQDMPFGLLVSTLRPERDRSRAPLAQVMCQLLPFDDGPPRLDGADVSRAPRHMQHVRFDLELNFWPRGPGVSAALAYRTDLFDARTIERWAEGLLALLQGIVANPDCPVAALPVLGERDRVQQIDTWSGEDSRRTREECVHDVFAAQARQHPESIAAIFPGEPPITYRQLDLRADALARDLRAHGVLPDSRVGLCLPPSVEMLVGMLGILKAGGAYVPLDATYPPSRLAYMMRDASLDIVVADDRAPACVSATARSIVSSRTRSGQTSDTTSSLGEPLDPSRAAYVMYTSGSTGQPKGVVVPHRAIIRLVRDTDYVRFESSDCVGQTASTSFDGSTFEIWGALLNGARLIGISREDLLSPPALRSVIRDSGISVLFLTTSLFHAVVARDPGMFAGVRYVVVGGEALDHTAVRAVRESNPPQHLLNGYGPTENTTFSTCCDVTALALDMPVVPIGRPIAGSTCYVLDAGGTLLPQGAAGELYVGGEGLADGYIRQPDLTAEKFVAHPWRAGERLYRTGDRVRWGADGCLHYMGRLDAQVKIRGHRVETGEIEHVLGTHPDVLQCVVTLAETRGTERRLIAYWVPRPDTATGVESLRDHARDRLPDYMVPASFVMLPTLPVTANGKVDREALPAPAIPTSDDGEPATPTERALAALWSDVLRLDRVGVHDDFFECGGDSLMLVTLAAEIEERFGRRLRLADIGARPTVAHLARVLESKRPMAREERVTRIHGTGSKVPLYFPPGLLGESLAYERLVDRLPLDQPVHVIASRSVVGRPSLTIEEVAGEYAGDLEAFQPEGALSLAGYSFSGILAFEMARQLSLRGRVIKLLAIIDTGPPSPPPGHVRDLLVAGWRFAANLPRWIRDDIVADPGRSTAARLRRSFVKQVKQWLRPRWPEADRSIPSAHDIFDMSDWPENLRAHAEANLQALRTFQYRQYQGHLVVFRAKTRPLLHSHAPDLGWGEVVQGGVEVIDVPGNHHTITCEPRLDTLARAFAKAVERE